MLGKANQPQIIDRKIWLTVNEAAKLSRYSKEYIRRLARGDTLVSLKIGPILLIERQSLIDYTIGYTVSPQLRLSAPKTSESDTFAGLTFEQWLGMSEKQRGGHRSILRQQFHELLQASNTLVFREGKDETLYDIVAALESNGRTNFVSSELPTKHK
jgi:hypothetical protein